MKLRFFFLCGMIAPVLFVCMTILGGILRPGYSHLANTVSELFSPGSPNKPLLDTFHTIFAFLLILFGIGTLIFIRRRKQFLVIGTLGAALYIAMGFVSVATAAIFPQDPWGAPATFEGEMHLRLTAVVGLLSLASILLIGFWFHRTKLSPGIWVFSLAIVGAVVLSTMLFIASLDGPWMGLTERISALIGFLWTFNLARWLYLNDTELPVRIATG